MSLKLDMSKAYNIVNWSFLREVMQKMGLDPKFIELIMECVFIVSYSVLINGVPQDIRLPQRELHQDDPLSPPTYSYFPLKD